MRKELILPVDMKEELNPDFSTIIFSKVREFSV